MTLAELAVPRGCALGGAGPHLASLQVEFQVCSEDSGDMWTEDDIENDSFKVGSSIYMAHPESNLFCWALVSFEQVLLIVDKVSKFHHIGRSDSVLQTRKDVTCRSVWARSTRLRETGCAAVSPCACDSFATQLVSGTLFVVTRQCMHALMPDIDLCHGPKYE